MVKVHPESSTSIRVQWLPPPLNKQNGEITYYKLFYVIADRPDSEATMIEIPAEKKEFIIDELSKWAEYRVWMSAGTQIGDGPVSYPESVKTDEDGTNTQHILKLFFYKTKTTDTHKNTHAALTNPLKTSPSTTN